MKKTLTLSLLAALLVLFLLTSPLWLDRLSAAALDATAEPRVSSKEPPPPTSSPAASFLFVDYGAVDDGKNYMELRVTAAPRLTAWVPGQSGPLWSVELGFISGVWADAAVGRVYVLEQLKAGQDSIKDLTFRYYETNLSNPDWPLYLTELDSADGKLLKRRELGPPPSAALYGTALSPLGVRNGQLYLMRSYYQGRVLVLDLDRAEFLPETVSLCAAAYPLRAELSSSGEQVYTLCADYTTGIDTWVTITPLDGGKPVIIDLPDFEEDRGMGNGLLLTPDGALFAIDTGLQVLVEIDVQRGKLGETTYYTEGFEAEAASSSSTVFAWLRGQIIRSASAKLGGWALYALSPDGRWLAVDGGFGQDGDTRTIWLIDLQTLRAVEHFTGLPNYPVALAFDGSQTLYALIDRQISGANATLVAFDLTSGEATQFSLDLGAHPFQIIPLQD